MIRKKLVTHKASASATNTADQIPSMPKKTGKSRMQMTSNTSVRRKDIVAETLPLFSAVKKEDPNMLKPLSRYTKA